MLFTQLGLRSELTEAVKAKGYTEPSPIQAQAIPAILAGKDVIGGAQTGTGKTAAFGLPLLQILAESEFKTKRPRTLILAPTRELAAQVHQSITEYGKRLNLQSAVIFGGVGFNQQVTALRRGLDIIVATPGRLIDLCRRREAN
ncbi:MAG TPA: ATP-dependent RNA helicase RhlE, partial [Opitutae bacterium]|nr:ATP-dependent RNA helicase RhlE [Opitutae bacterium]